MNEAGLLLYNHCKEVMHNSAKLHSHVMTSDMSTMSPVLSIMRAFMFLLLNKSFKVLTTNKLLLLTCIKKYACEKKTVRCLNCVYTKAVMKIHRKYIFSKCMVLSEFCRDICLNT